MFSKAFFLRVVKTPGLCEKGLPYYGQVMSSGMNANLVVHVSICIPKLSQVYLIGPNHAGSCSFVLEDVTNAQSRVKVFSDMLNYSKKLCMPD